MLQNLPRSTSFTWTALAGADGVEAAWVGVDVASRCESLELADITKCERPKNI